MDVLEKAQGDAEERENIIHSEVGSLILIHRSVSGRHAAEP